MTSTVTALHLTVTQGDEFDHDDDLMRRTEYIETQAHGLLHARMIGDAEQPLILYLHSSKVRARNVHVTSK